MAKDISINISEPSDTTNDNTKRNNKEDESTCNNLNFLKGVRGLEMDRSKHQLIIRSTPNPNNIIFRSGNIPHKNGTLTLTTQLDEPKDNENTTATNGLLTHRPPIIRIDIRKESDSFSQSVISMNDREDEDILSNISIQRGCFIYNCLSSEEIYESENYTMNKKNNECMIKSNSPTSKIPAFINYQGRKAILTFSVDLDEFEKLNLIAFIASVEVLKPRRSVLNCLSCQTLVALIMLLTLVIVIILFVIQFFTMGQTLGGCKNDNIVGSYEFDGLIEDEGANSGSSGSSGGMESNK